MNAKVHDNILHRSEHYSAVLFGSRRLISAECLAHGYSWESCHSTLNDAGGALVLSRPFSERFDLRSVPQAFHQVLPDGSPLLVRLRRHMGLPARFFYAVAFEGVHGCDIELVCDRIGVASVEPYAPAA